MIDCISVKNMRLSDAYTIENFVPGLILMNRAAWGVYRAVAWKGPIAIVAGSGNNGGDGFALACILKGMGYFCTVYTVSTKMSEDSAHYANKAAQLGVPIKEFEAGCLPGFEMIVDCLLGTGFSGIVRGNYRTAIEQINAANAFVVSVDINSGMNGDTGEAELAVKSDLTVTIGYVKTGLVMPKGGAYMKKLVCADIGIVLLREEGKICGPQEQLLPGCIRCPDWLDMDIIPVLD